MTFGVKIALPGFDARTATPEQCAVDSRFDTMKVKVDPVNPNFGNIIVKFQDNPVIGTYPIYTINHNYGYIPLYYFFFSVRDSTANTGIETGNFFPGDALNFIYFQATATATQIIFQLVVTNTSIEALSGNTYAFRYYVFANDGT